MEQARQGSEASQGSAASFTSAGPAHMLPPREAGMLFAITFVVLVHLAHTSSGCSNPGDPPFCCELKVFEIVFGTSESRRDAHLSLRSTHGCSLERCESGHRSLIAQVAHHLGRLFPGCRRHMLLPCVEQHPVPLSIWGLHIGLAGCQGPSDDQICPLGLFSAAGSTY